MKVSKLKEILKPLIRECVREIIFEEDGAISHIVSEVSSGLTRNQSKMKLDSRVPVSRKNAVLRKENLNTIGKDAYQGIDFGKPLNKKVEKIKEGSKLNGINLFEGTVPLNEKEAETPVGTDISFLDEYAPNWKKMLGGDDK